MGEPPSAKVRRRRRPAASPSVSVSRLRMNLRLLSALLATSFLAAAPQAEEGEFMVDGVKVHYVTEGAGVPLVLLHGWMADTTMWGRDAAGKTKLDAQGAEGFQLIALDCRGHGQSGKPLEPEKYGVELAEDVVRLLDHLKLEKAHLLGYSSGAFIAGHVAATHPERVLSVVFAGQAPLVSGAPSSFEEVELFARMIEEGADLAEYVLAITPSNLPRPTLEQARAYADFMFAGKDVEALARAGLSFPELEVTQEAFARCTAPMLFIHGEQESAHVKGRVASVRQVLGRGELVVIPRGNHVTTLMQPEFTPALLAFLRGAGSANDQAGGTASGEGR